MQQTWFNKSNNFPNTPQFYRQSEPFIEMGWSIGPCEVASKPQFFPKFCLRLSGYHLSIIYILSPSILMLTCVRQQENGFWLRDLSLLMAVLTLARLNLFSSCTTAAAHWSTVNIPVSAGPVSLFRYIVYSVQKVWVLALCIVFERVCVWEGGRLWITKARAMLVPASRAVSYPQTSSTKEREELISLSLSFSFSLSLSVRAAGIRWAVTGGWRCLVRSREGPARAAACLTIKDGRAPIHESLTSPRIGAAQRQRLKMRH